MKKSNQAGLCGLRGLGSRTDDMHSPDYFLDQSYNSYDSDQCRTPSSKSTRLGLLELKKSALPDFV